VRTVSVHLQRAMAVGLRWPLPADLDDAALEARLFAGTAVGTFRLSRCLMVGKEER
jgi:hypothetical protein